MEPMVDNPVREICERVAEPGVSTITVADLEGGQF
jgi:hypothetical protein